MNRSIINWLLIFCVGWAVLGAAACSKGHQGGSMASQPAVKVANVSVSRLAQTGSLRFYFVLDATSRQPSSVQYATTDGTAKAGIDYTPVTGTATIPAGQTQTYVDVPVMGDSLRRPDQTFYLKLSSPVNCTPDSSQATGT